MAPGSSVGTATMLRARRRDVNVKPNRRLDRKSSRGMLYENEELRLRTININAEVERGQSDIKKLRRENEQLRREIWGLRDEYDRLEGLLGRLQGGAAEENADDLEYGTEDGRSSMVENEENIQKATSSIQSQNQRNSLKVEFDGLSVVDEETDDTPVGNAESSNTDSRARNEDNVLRESVYNTQPPNESTFISNGCSGMDSNHDKIPNDGMNVVISPYLDAPVVPRRKDGFCRKPHDLQVLLELQGSRIWGSSLYSNDINSESCTNLACRETHFPRKQFFSRVRSVNQMNVSKVPDCSTENNELLVQNGHTTRIGYAYSSLASGKTVATHPSEGSLNGNCFMPTPVYNVNSPSEEMTLPECFHIHGGPDFFISGAYPADMVRPQFPMGGNLEQLLQEVHERDDKNATITSHSQIQMNIQLPTDTGIDENQKLHHGGVDTQEADSSTPCVDHKAAATQPEPSPPTTEREREGKGGYIEESKLTADNSVALLVPQLETLTVGRDKSEDEATRDRFRSQLSIQLQLPKKQTSDEVIFATDTCSASVEATSNASYAFNNATQTSPKLRSQSEEENSTVKSKFPNNDSLFQRKLHRNPFEHGYQDFIASNPELSYTKTRLLSNSMQDLNCCPRNEGILPDEGSHYWRSNAYSRSQHIQDTQNTAENSPEVQQNYPNSHVQSMPLPNSSANLTISLPKPSDTKRALSAGTDDHTFHQNARLLAGNGCSSKHLSLDKVIQSSPHIPTNLSQNTLPNNNYLFLPSSNSCEAQASEHQPETCSVPPSPVSIHRQSPLRNTRRVSSSSQLRGEHMDEYCSSQKLDRSRKISSYHNMYGSKGDNTTDIGLQSPNVRRKGSVYRANVPPHRKMSVIVGDTQQGCLYSVDNSRSSSSGHDSPTKSDRKRRVSVYLNNKRRYGIGCRRDSGVSGRASSALTRSLSLDPTRCRLVAPAVDAAAPSGESGDRERTNSVSSRASSAAGATSLSKGKINQGSTRGVNASSQNKSVPWCACWGNGCI